MPSEDVVDIRAYLAAEAPDMCAQNVAGLKRTTGEMRALIALLGTLKFNTDPARAAVRPEVVEALVSHCADTLGCSPAGRGSGADPALPDDVHARSVAAGQWRCCGVYGWIGLSLFQVGFRRTSPSNVTLRALCEPWGPREGNRALLGN